MGRRGQRTAAEQCAAATRRDSRGTVVTSGGRFPDDSEVNYSGAANVRELFDYGPEFERGIISCIPPVPTGRAYATLVPKTDQDGIDIAGIKLPEIAVPIGTYTGWNPLARAPKDECSAMGSFIPFARTKDERVASGDPRLSLEERYGTHSRYAELVRQASGTSGRGKIDSAGRCGSVYQARRGARPRPAPLRKCPAPLLQLSEERVTRRSVRQVVEGLAERGLWKSKYECLRFP